MLAALWLYATVEGVGSARELARLYDEHAAYQWLCGGMSVNHKTLADFRVGHAEVIERLLTEGFAALRHAGVASLGPVVQDGMRVRAGAGAASFRRPPILRDCLREAEAAVARQRRDLAAGPAAASRRWKPARASAEAPERLRSSSITTMRSDAQPSCRARSTRPYCRRVDS